MTKKNKYTFTKKYNLFIPLFFIILFISSLKAQNNEFKHSRVNVIVIDPGHGGKDPGCSGHHHNEKTVALSVALKLGKYIETHIKNVKVIYTRTTDVFVDLEDRAKVANDNNADLFISIHCNAAGKPVMIKDKKTGKVHAKTYKNKKGKIVNVETTNPKPYGSETYVMGLKNEEGKMKVAQRENSAILLEDNYEKKYKGFDPNSEESYIIMSNYTSAYVIQSAGFAMKIQEEYSKKANRVDKGVHRQSLWVLWRTAMPSVLTEIGYLTNPQEEKFLGSEKGQDYLATCLFRAFRKYKDDVEGIQAAYNDEIENQKPLEKEVYISYEDSNLIVTPEENNLAKAKDEVTLFVTKQEETNNPEIPNSEPAIVNKADILKNYLDKTKKDSLKTASSNQLLSSEEITFKVQFTSQENLIDTKTNFTNITDIWYYKVGVVYKYTSGNFKKFDDASKHQLKLKELGYKDCFVVAFKNNERIDIKEAKLLVEKIKN